jgi:hypothetical protein
MPAQTITPEALHINRKQCHSIQNGVAVPHPQKTNYRETSTRFIFREHTFSIDMDALTGK